MTTSPSAPDHLDEYALHPAFDDPEYERFLNEMHEEHQARREGRAIALARCPIDDTLQGVVREFVTKGSDPSECAELRCGHFVL